MRAPKARLKNPPRPVAPRACCFAQPEFGHEVLRGARRDAQLLGDQTGVGDRLGEAVRVVSAAEADAGNTGARRLGVVSAGNVHDVVGVTKADGAAGNLRRLR